MRVLSSNEIKKLENKCFETNLPSRLAMENAGRAVVYQILERFSELKKVVVFCGSGNNGGDGFVIARVLLDLGIDTNIILVGDINKFSKETSENYSLLSKSIFVKNIDENTSLIVDALLGTGSSGAAKGSILEAISTINLLSRNKDIPVVAVDLPSGVCPNTGEVGSEAISADLTITFQYPKWGNILSQNNGLVIVANIGLGITEDGAYLLDSSSFDSIRFSLDIHKGQKGHVLVIGGSQGKNGSIKLAGMAALKSASGLATLAVPEDQRLAFSNTLLELMTSVLPSDGKGDFVNAPEDRILEIIKGKNAVVLGPGMGLGCAELLKNLINCCNKLKIPTVLDADALSMLPELDIILNHNFILTPHPGEMAKLLNSSSAEVQKERRKAVTELSLKYSCWSILKGAQTLISSPEGQLAVCNYSCPALATAGSGDVLAGLLASFLGAGFSSQDSCYMAVYSHACAGLILEDAQLGTLGTSATDIIDTLPIVLNCLSRNSSKSLFSVLGEQEFLNNFLDNLD